MFEALKTERGWFKHHAEVYRLLDLNPKAHLPAEGFFKEVAGLRFHCKPANTAIKTSTWTGRITHRPLARLFVECPCGRWVPFGRLSQHVKGRAHNLPSEE